MAIDIPTKTKKVDTKIENPSSYIAEYLISKPEELGEVLQSLLRPRADFGTSLSIPSPRSIAVTKDLFEFFSNIQENHSESKKQHCHAAISKVIQHELNSDTTVSAFVDAIATALEPIISMRPKPGEDGLAEMGTIETFRNLPRSTPIRSAAGLESMP